MTATERYLDVDYEVNYNKTAIEKYLDYEIDYSKTLSNIAIQLQIQKNLYSAAIEEARIILSKLEG